MADGVVKGEFSKRRSVFLGAGVLAAGIFWAMAVWPGSAYAGIENRPLNSDDAYVLPPGAVAVSVGSVYTRAHNDDDQVNLVTDLGVGLLKRLELSATFPYIFFDPETGSNADGFGDITIRPEWMVLSEADLRPAISIAGTIKFDNGNNDKNLGSGAVDYGGSLQVSKTFEALTLHVNVGFTAVGKPTDIEKDDTVSYNVGVEYALTQKLKLVGEMFGQSNADPTATHDPLEWLLGGVFTISKSLALDVGFGTGLNNDSPDLRVTGGLTYTF